jgi:hypothetical protein
MATTQNHAQTAREFLIAAGREFEAGDKLQGSERMWGAAAHAIMAVALQRGWSCGNHYTVKSAADRIAAEMSDLSLTGGSSRRNNFTLISIMTSWKTAIFSEGVP